MNDFIDWVRDEADLPSKKLLSVRHALRCLPLIFSAGDQVVALKNLRGALTANVLLTFQSSLQTYERIFKQSKSHILESPADNVWHTTQQALRAVTATSVNEVSRNAELCIADGLDAARDSVVASEKLAETVPDSVGTTPSIGELQNALVEILRLEAIDHRDYDEGFVQTEPLWRHVDSNVNYPPNASFQVSLEQWDEWATDSQRTWQFWRDWYQGFLDGHPLDLELQCRVALIANPIWDAGPEAVANEIEKIQALFNLEQDIAAVKKQLAATATAPSMIGDNGGPPLEDAASLAVQKDIQLVREQVARLESEITKPEPSPSILNGIARRLFEISKRIAAYCGEKMDLVLTEAAKETGKAIGKWGAPLAILYATQNESVRSLAQAIKDYALTLP